MRFTGRKRKKDPPDEGQQSSQRTCDDILNVDFTSILPQKENPQNIPTKKPRLRPLHCRECDNKFTSAEALERHYQNKTNNIGSQIILARNFKKDGSQTISCRESNCCYSCNKLSDIMRTIGLTTSRRTSKQGIAIVLYRWLILLTI